MGKVSEALGHEFLETESDLELCKMSESEQKTESDFGNEIDENWIKELEKR